MCRTDFLKEDNNRLSVSEFIMERDKASSAIQKRCKVMRTAVWGMLSVIVGFSAYLGALIHLF